MRIISGGLCLFFTCAFAFADHEGDDRRHFLAIQALNSPVKESLAKFQFTLPSGMIATKTIYRFEEKERRDLDRDEKHGRRDRDENGGKAHKPKFKLDESPREISLVQTPQGLVAQIPVSELPPGAFVVSMEVRATKSWMEKIKGLFRGHEESEEFRGRADFVIDASLEVPDPGPAGMTTLAGIDSDGDGVRDDVQRWIAESYGDSLKMKAALKQAAAVDQLKLLNALDKAKSIAASYQGFKAADCMRYLRGSNEARKLRKKVESLMLNTDARIRADIKVHANFSGQSWSPRTGAEEKLGCAFDPDALPN